VIGSLQRPLTNNTQHAQERERDIPAPGGIRTGNGNNLAVTETGLDVLLRGVRVNIEM